MELPKRGTVVISQCFLQGLQMKNHLRIFAFAGLGTMTMLASFVAACGDDDESVEPVTTFDSGTDARADTGTDVDAEVPHDAGSDADAAPSVPQYEMLIENAICGSFSRCCFGNSTLKDGQPIDGGPGVDAGYYVAQGCKKNVVNAGFELSSLGIENYDAGAIHVDPAAAADCISKLSALSCDLMGPDLIAARAACFNAFVGTKSLGQACAASIECPIGQVCQPDTDAGSGKSCQPLKGQGGLCSVFPLAPQGTNESLAEFAGRQFVNAVKSEEACSTRGGGDTKLRCSTYNSALSSATNPNGYPPRDQWTCQATVANGSDCDSNVWCSAGTCDSTSFTCVASTEYFAGGCADAVSPNPVPNPQGH